MKYLVNFFVIIFFLLYLNIANSNNNIVYINMNQVFNKSLAGKFINEGIDKIHKINISEFKQIEKELKNEEKLILSQKNILSDAEYQKKINLLKDKIKIYKNKQKQKLDDLNNKRVKAKTELLTSLNSILSKYSLENNISFILNKENVVIAKKDLDITTEIIKLLNDQIKKVELN